MVEGGEPSGSFSASLAGEPAFSCSHSEAAGLPCLPLGGPGDKGLSWKKAVRSLGCRDENLEKRAGIPGPPRELKATMPDRLEEGECLPIRLCSCLG